MARLFGSGDRISKQVWNSSFGFGGPSGAVAFKFRTTETTLNAIVLEFGDAGSGDCMLFIVNNVLGKITAYGKGDTGDQAFLQPSTITINDGAWHTVVFNFQTGNATPYELFVDGVSQGSGIIVNWFLGPGYPLNIGQSTNSFWAAFIGEVCNFGLWERNLTAGEALSFSEGAPVPAIAPEKLLSCIPLLTSVTDLVQGNLYGSATVTGTTISPQPSQFYRF